MEAAGHRGECHTERNLGGAMDRERWLAGGPAAETTGAGTGRVPNITTGAGGIGAWSASEIAFYLETGFRQDFDVVGGAMSAVQRNMAMLAPEDRQAIAAYLKAVPPRDSDDG